MDQKLSHTYSPYALYVHWPYFDTKEYTNFFVGYALKKQLNRYLYTNYLHLNGPIYFGREVRTQWPEDVLLDILGILKKRAKSPDQQISLEIDVRGIGQYNYRRLCAAGINRYNIVADCGTGGVIELIEAGCRYLQAAGCFEHSVAIELLCAHRNIVSTVVQRARQLAITHLTVWPDSGAHEAVRTALTSGSFIAYERYHYGYDGHYSAYMKHMWDQKTIIGIGPGAESMIGNKRYKNAICVGTYVHEINWSDHVDVSVLHEQELLSEYIMLNIGRANGVSLRRCAAVMGKKQFRALYERINCLQAQGWMWCSQQMFGISAVAEPVYQAIVEDLMCNVI